MRIELIIGGLGGQGVRAIGEAVGALAIIRDLYATSIFRYTPEVRGNSIYTISVISDEPIDYPGAMDPDIIIFLHQRPYYDDSDLRRIVDSSRGIIIAEEDLAKDLKGKKIAIERLASERLKRFRLNAVVFGLLGRLLNDKTELKVSLEDLINAFGYMGRLRGKEKRFLSEENIASLRFGYETLAALV